MRIDLIFTYHAACRWFQRCAELDFRSEVAQLKRDKQQEKTALKKGHRKCKVYRTKSGVKLVVVNNHVITVMR